MAMSRRFMGERSPAKSCAAASRLDWAIGGMPESEALAARYDVKKE
jgi:hypothetical protein